MSNQTINANRDLPAAQAIALLKKHLPALCSGVGADRNWLWWSGPKPDEATRKTLAEIGWRFSGKPHTLADDRVAHWYHACGGPVVFRRKGGAQPAPDAETAPEASTQVNTPAPKARKPAERVNPTASTPPAGGKAVSNLLNLLQNLDK